MAINDIKNFHKLLACDKKYPDMFFDLVWTHSHIVFEICTNLIKNLPVQVRNQVDKSLLEKGAMIHDIGVYLCFDEDFNPDSGAPAYFYHGWEGQMFLKNQGITDEKLLRFTTVHTGVGITKQDIERENLVLPKKDYIPISLEEELLTYGDKFHTKSPAFVCFEKAKTKLEKLDLAKGKKMDYFHQKFGFPDLEILKEKYRSWHKKFDAFWKKIGES